MRRLLALFVAVALFSAPVFSQKKDSYRVRTVVIDPGHGGAKPGAQGGRVQEKTLTLSIAKKFGKLISDNYPEVKVIYTRTTDVDISLAERAHIANRNKADLFISIHANSHPTASPTGVETFVMGLSESRANLEVAKKENADILLEADYKNNNAYKDFDPNSPESYVMLAMFQNSFIDKSLNLAQAIQNQYKQNIKTINRGVKQAELFVLYKTTCPSVLTEVGFISNPAEEAFMMSDEGQAKIAISLFNAFMNYKAMEEGTNKIANPKLDIPGVPKRETPKEEVVAEEKKAAPVAEEKKAAPVAEEKKPTPAVEEKKAAPVSEEKKAAPVAEEKKPTPVVEEKKAAPVVEEEKPVVEEEVVVAEAPRQQRPVPSSNLAPQQPQPVKPQPEKLQSEPPQTDNLQSEKPQPEKSQPEKSQPEKSQPEKSQPEKSQPENTQPQPEKTTPTSTTTPAALVAVPAPKNSSPKGETEFFTVQFLTSSKELQAGAPEFMGMKEVLMTRNGTLYCYSVGRFATFNEANEYAKKVQQATAFKDAWALRRHADKVQNLGAAPATQSKAAAGNKPTQAAPAVQKEKAAAVPAPAPAEKGIVYRVQFCTSHSQFKVGAPDMHGIKDFRYSKSGQVYIYTAGNYKTLAEAKQRCAAIKKSTPFKDAFVVGYKNGKRFNVE